MTWHVDVPMIATICPGATARAAGAVTWASTLPTATAMPSGRPRWAAISAVNDPARPPSRPIGWSSLSVTKSAKPGSSSARKSLLGYCAVLEDALVAGAAGVAHVLAAQLPDDPVGGLDPAFHRRVDLGVAVEQLETLGVLPLRRDQPAVAGQPRLAAPGGELVDAVGLGLGGVVLPQLDVGVGTVLELAETAQRGAVGRASAPSCTP